MKSLKQIKQYLELAENATPGPWKSEKHLMSYDDVLFVEASSTMGPALANALIRAIQSMKPIANDHQDEETRNHFKFALADIEKILSGGCK